MPLAHPARLLLAMQSFHNLRVTGRVRELNRIVYMVTAKFPSDERFGLVSQMRRASISIGANIAEGCGRQGDRGLLAFLQIAMGSANELEFEALAASDLGLLTLSEHRALVEAIGHVKRMLASLIADLRGHDVRSTMRRITRNESRRRD